MAASDALIDLDQRSIKSKFGFAILALDFAVIESLQGFVSGKASHQRKSKDLTVQFLQAWKVFTDCVPSEKSRDYAILVYEEYRCALHHTASTGVGFAVGISGSAFDFANYPLVRINRTKLHRDLVDWYDAYYQGLLTSDSESSRANFLNKMNHIAGVAN